MKKQKTAAFLMIVHGGFIEIGGTLCAFPALVLEADKFDAGQYFSFKLPYFRENIYMMLVIGGVFGALRVVGAAGLLKDRMWGLALSFTNCVITLLLMMFLLPVGILDGMFAGIAMVLMLMDYFGNERIEQFKRRGENHGVG